MTSSAAPSNSRVILDVQDLHKSFGPKHVHRGVSFQLHQGEILGLLGGSGTGKSVILRSLIGLEKPDAGHIYFNAFSPALQEDGKQVDITRLSESALTPVRVKIGYVFQNGALFDSLTVEDNLAYPLRAHTNLSEREVIASVNQMLDLIDMKGSNNLFPSELSGGMQKRAGLARAIILDPQVILFDEPTAGLDPVNTHRLLQNIHKLKSRGITGIFVTHDIPAAFEICDRIAILYQGKIYINDTVANIRASKDPLVRRFITGDLDTHPSSDPNKGTHP